MFLVAEKIMSLNEFDLIVLGSGDHGETAIQTLEEQGKKVLYIDLQSNLIASMSLQVPVNDSEEVCRKQSPVKLFVHTQSLNTSLYELKTYLFQSKPVQHEVNIHTEEKVKDVEEEIHEVEAILEKVEESSLESGLNTEDSIEENQELDDSNVEIEVTAEEILEDLSEEIPGKENSEEATIEENHNFENEVAAAEEEEFESEELNTAEEIDTEKSPLDLEESDHDKIAGTVDLTEEPMQHEPITAEEFIPNASSVQQMNGNPFSLQEYTISEEFVPNDHLTKPKATPIEEDEMIDQPGPSLEEESISINEPAVEVSKQQSTVENNQSEEVEKDKFASPDHTEGQATDFASIKTEIFSTTTKEKSTITEEDNYLAGSRQNLTNQLFKEKRESPFEPRGFSLRKKLFRRKHQLEAKETSATEKSAFENMENNRKEKEPNEIISMNPFISQANQSKQETYSRELKLRKKMLGRSRHSLSYQSHNESLDQEKTGNSTSSEETFQLNTTQSPFFQTQNLSFQSSFAKEQTEESNEQSAETRQEASYQSPFARKQMEESNDQSTEIKQETAFQSPFAKEQMEESNDQSTEIKQETAFQSPFAKEQVEESNEQPAEATQEASFQSPFAKGQVNQQIEQPIEFKDAPFQSPFARGQQSIEFKQESSFQSPFARGQMRGNQTTEMQTEQSFESPFRPMETQKENTLRPSENPSMQKERQEEFIETGTIETFTSRRRSRAKKKNRLFANIASRPLQNQMHTANQTQSSTRNTNFSQTSFASTQNNFTQTSMHMNQMPPQEEVEELVNSPYETNDPQTQEEQNNSSHPLKRDTIEFEDAYGYNQWEDFFTPFSHSSRKRQELNKIEKRKIALRGLHNLINNLG